MKSAPPHVQTKYVETMDAAVFAVNARKAGIAQIKGSVLPLPVFHNVTKKIVVTMPVVGSAATATKTKPAEKTSFVSLPASQTVRRKTVGPMDVVGSAVNALKPIPVAMKVSVFQFV